MRIQNVTYVKVGDGLHLLVLGDHMDDQRVPNQAHQHDEAEESGDQPGVHQHRGPLALQSCRLVAHRLTASQCHLHKAQPGGDLWYRQYLNVVKSGLMLLL